LKDHDVRFRLVGGYAVNAFGYVRNTINIDLWIEGTQESQTRVMQAIREFGFASAPADALDGPNAMLRMGNPLLRIEVLKKLSGVEFEACLGRRVELAVEDLVVPMISLTDLKANKSAAGRPKDLADLSNLP
jgi:hypothetical protein